MDTAASSITLRDGAELAMQLLAGRTLGPDMGLDEQKQEALYHVGQTLYNQAKYDDALRLFNYLVIADHFDRRHYKGVAACLQMLKRHEQAAKYWAIASYMDLTDPAPPLHSAECLLAMGDQGKAKLALRHALTQARGNPAHARYVARAEAILQFIDGEGADRAAPKEKSDE